MITFGNYKWRQLDRQDNRMLVITEDVIDLQWYHDRFEPVTWETCTLRRYLNHEFYDLFSVAEQNQILKASNENPDNPWFKTQGGNPTIDHIFLLSLEEACRYFGQSKLEKGNQRWLADDKNNHLRIATYQNEPHSWRLRSPGYYDRTSASINLHGQIYFRGNGVYGRPKDGGGLRPALWLKTSGSAL